MVLFVETRSALGNQVLGCPIICIQTVNQYYFVLEFLKLDIDSDR